MSAIDSERALGAAERLLETAKRNPEGALLVAAGVCLMMRGMGRNTGFWRSAPRTPYRAPAGYAPDGNADLNEDQQSRGMMDAVRERASDMTGRVRQSAEEMASGVSGRVRQSAEEMAAYADHVRRAAADTSGRIVGRTTSTVQGGVERMVDEQPLALAMLGLAAGAAVAALVPPTRIEARTFGPIGERIAEGAEEAGRRVRESATAAGMRLAAEGIAEARNVARNLASEPAGDEKGQSTASGATDTTGRPFENGKSDKSDKGPGSSFGPGSSGTGRAG